jgi:non-heme chloroperoxidase
MHMSTMQVSKAVKLDFVRAGWRSGVPVLLLHGYTDSRRSYDRVLVHMSRSLNAVAVSQRGHGDSERPLDGYDPADFAADLIRLMDQLSIPQAVIIGHSMGGTVAQKFAIDYPLRTLGLVLVGSFYTLRDHAVVKDFWDSTVSRLSDPIDPAVIRDFQQSTLAGPVPEAFFETIVSESSKVPAHVWKAALYAMINADLRKDLRRIQEPTRLIWGDRDAFASRSEQQALLDAIPNSRLTVYKGVGHSPHWEDPDRFVSDVLQFTARM